MPRRDQEPSGAFFYFLFINFIPHFFVLELREKKAAIRSKVKTFFVILMALFPRSFFTQGMRSEQNNGD